MLLVLPERTQDGFAASGAVFVVTWIKGEGFTRSVNVKLFCVMAH
jgi:hypothetical protein